MGKWFLAADSRLGAAAIVSCLGKHTECWMPRGEREMGVSRKEQYFF